MRSAISQVAIGTLRLGTRGSALALAQAEAVAARAARRHPELAVDRVVVSTAGDLDKTSPLSVIGGRGVFTSALQEALVAGRIDAAVHSAKDLPSEQHPALAFAAFLAREDARDVLVSRHGLALAALPDGPVIGTSSRRRAVQVRAARPDARIVELRGNIDTRLRKALETDVDGIVLAAAGIARMGWERFVTEHLPLDAFVPAPGQAALAVETRAADQATRDLIGPLDEPAVAVAVRAERAFLGAIGGGCTTPVGAHAVVEGNRVWLRCMLASEDGARVEWADERYAVADAEAGAADLARRLHSRVEPGGWATNRRGVAMVGAATAESPDDRDEPLPLAGRSVLVTRAREQAGGLVAALRAAGAEPVEAPTIRIVDAHDPTPLDRALAGLGDGDYAWVVFTSTNAVQRVLSRLAARGEDATAFDRVKVAAVGDATAARLREAGGSVDLVPARPTADGIVAELTDRVLVGHRVLLPQGSLARDGLARGLRAVGAVVDAVEVYRTVPETVLPTDVGSRIARGEVDVVTFASPSAVRNLAALLGGTLAPLRGATIACVGPTTAEAARAAGLAVDLVADDPSVGGLVAALVGHLPSRSVVSPVDAGASAASGLDAADPCGRASR
jgi:hydroxymethylbilane synthase